MADARERPLILVADDDRDLRNMVLEELSGGPWDLVSAEDGEQALFLALERQPDLVLLDVMMPRLSGWEVCREIRLHPELDACRVIILTAIGHTLNELTSPLYGADSYIDKPFDLDVLRKAVEEILAAPAPQR